MELLSKSQELIYETEQFAGGAVNVICGGMLTAGEKEPVAMTEAVRELFRINSALRMRIVETGGRAFWTVADNIPQEIRVQRFADKAALDRYAEAYAKEPFDFHGPLCEIQVILTDSRSGILIKLHHIAGDAWTMALIATQFNTLLKGEKFAAYSYEEHLAKERAYIQGEAYLRDKAFFMEEFQKCSEVTYLSEKQNHSLQAARKRFVLTQEQTQKITAYADRKDVSLFALFMAVFGVYISRIRQNVESFYLGTAFLNRFGAREKNTAGMFVNTVPVLIALDYQKSFLENLSEIKTKVFSAMRHQKFHYGETLAAIRREYHFKEKLYDVMLSYQNAEIKGTDESESTWYHCGAQTESLQIHIDDRDRSGAVHIQYDYQTEKFTPDQIESMQENFVTLLLDAVENDNKRLWELELLSAEEKQKLLFAFNDTAVDYPREKCVHELFEEQVEKTPDRVALVFENESFTYRQLDAMSNSLANFLREQEVKPNQVVPIVAKRSWHIFVAMLGILKAGAAYMPVDTDYPLERIQYMFDTANVKIALTFGYEKHLPVRKIVLEKFDFSKNSSVLPNVNTANDLCYVIFTSGSTGMPKGVSVCHRNVVNCCDDNDYNQSHAVIKKEYQRIVSVANFTFDIFATDSLLVLLNGKAVYLANDKESMLQNELSRLVILNSIDVIQITPTKLRSYMMDKQKLDYLKQFKVIILGGEAFSFELYEELRNNTDAFIYNLYGPTETTVVATESIIKDSNITIGKPIANTQIYIVDKYLNPIPIGVTGELCIAGDGVSAGYLNRPELTAEKFIDNPFGNGKLYRTGDLAYWREDGNIVYVGRNDFQVKIRGLRIELGEIENCICSVETVLQSAVVVRQDEAGRQYICAFYTAVSDREQEIKNTISTKLPRYMMPHIFTKLDAMPMTPSGKIDRKALPEVDLHSYAAESEYTAPQTAQEKVLIAAAEVVLGVKKLGMRDNFFDYGGDSLKAIELVVALETSGYHVDIRDIFEAVTFERLAEKLSVFLNHTGKEDVHRHTLSDIPATPAQLRIYTAHSRSGNTAYNVPYVFHVDNPDAAKLQSVVSLLIRRHEMLRTHFENRDGQILQVVDADADCKAVYLERNEIKAFIRPFDLDRAPLLRVGYGRDFVVIDMHHIITDGRSMTVFLRELNELYMGRTLPDNPTQYREFALQKVDNMLSEQYWLSVFADELPVLELNTDFPRKGRQTFGGTALYERLPLSIHEKICDKCREQKITPYAFYMGAFQILLSKFSGSGDIAVGIPTSGRSGKFMDTIGMFVNTVVIRSQPGGTKTVGAFLQEISRTTVEALEHQDYPYGELVKKLGIHAENRNPLFDVMFAYQSAEQTMVFFADESAKLLEIPIANVKYDITFNIMPEKSDVALMVEYCTDLYKETTILRMVEGYKQLLLQMLDTDRVIRQLSAVTVPELQKLLYEFNDTVADYPKEKCVHELFEEQVERMPEKTALIFGENVFTYSQLNAMVNGLAWNLKKKGVGSGDIVGILAKRSYEIVIAILAILKAGAAYLPIDCNYPQDRIDMIIKDSKCKILLVHGLEYIFKQVMYISDNIFGDEKNPPNQNSSMDVKW